MKELLLENLKTYNEVLKLKQLEKRDILKEVNAHKKLEKMTKQFQENGIEVNIPPADEKMIKLKEVETEIKMCKSIIRRYENVIQMYEVGECEEYQQDEE